MQLRIQIIHEYIAVLQGKSRLLNEIKNWAYHLQISSFSKSVQLNRVYLQMKNVCELIYLVPVIESSLLRFHHLNSTAFQHCHFLFCHYLVFVNSSHIFHFLTTSFC